MSDVTVRPFRRDDRHQLTELVNAHIQAVIPGLMVSVNRVLSQLEREPDEFIVDRWVVERITLVAEQRGRLVAAAHLLRYRDDEQTAAGYRGAGDIRWLVSALDAPYWPDASVAGDELVRAAVRLLSRAGVTRILADGALPAPGVFGIPDSWPHVRELLVQNGFAAGARIESVWAARLDDLPRSTPPDFTLRRTLGSNGTRFSASSGQTCVGYIDVDLRSAEIGRSAAGDGWADVGNLWVPEPLRRRGIGTWLLGEAADWLRFGGVTNLLDYCDQDDSGYRGFLQASGFRLLGTSSRGWQRETES